MNVDIMPSSDRSPSSKRRLSKSTSPSFTRWHVVHTHMNSEGLASSHLERQGFCVFLPKRRRIIRHARKSYEVRDAFFPRYLFVAFDIKRTQWRRINSTIGVSNLLCIQSRPLALPPGLVEDLIAATDSDGILRRCENLEVGQKVRILSGPLEDSIGKLAENSDNEEVKIFIELMAREVSVYIQRDFIISIS